MFRAPIFQQFADPGTIRRRLTFSGLIPENRRCQLETAVQMLNSRWIVVALVAAWPCFSPRIASAQEVEQRELPAAIQRVLEWLPEDTETIVASQQFILPSDAEFRLYTNQLQFFLRVLPLYEFANLGKGKYVRPLARRKVALALRGGRNYGVVSKFGHHRSEGCAIVIFEDDLGDVAKEWTALLRTEATEVRQIAGHDVFVFPSATLKPGNDADRELETYLGIIEPGTILCATSEKYLNEILDRLAVRPARRALPDSLPEWKHVDPVAPAWMLRHIPETKKGRIISGAAWSITKTHLRVVYSPLPERSDEVETQAHEMWEPGLLEAEFNVKFKPEFERLKDGAVAVSAKTGKLDSHGHFIFRLNMYALQAENGVVGNQ